MRSTRDAGIHPKHMIAYDADDGRFNYCIILYDPQKSQMI